MALDVLKVIRDATHDFLEVDSMFEKLGTIVLATGMMLASSCVVAQADPQQASGAANAHVALAPGDAAGVKKAEGWAGANTALLVAGGVVVVGGAILLSNHGGNHNSSATTTHF